MSIRSAKGRRIKGGLISWCTRFLGTCLWLWLPADFATADTCEVFCGARDQLQITTLTPIRQLEGEALFQSAAALRERVMPPEQRLLNQLWLHDTAATRIQGGRVWSRLLRHSLAQLRDQKPQLQENSLDLLKFDGDTDKAEYRLRVSGDTIRLLVHYDF